MNRLESYSKKIMLLFIAILLPALVVGCSSGTGKWNGSDGTIPVVTSSTKAITTYSINNVAGIINETAKTIGVTLPFGTNVSALVATFTTTGASVNVGTTLQASGTTPNNFTLPVTYTVTAADGTTAAYSVTVVVASASAKAIAPYSIAGQIGAINEAAKTIGVIMPFGTNVTALVATFTSTGVGAPTVGGINQISGITPNNFTLPVTYMVTAADNTTAIYTVTVVVAPAAAKAIAPYSLNGVEGIINEAAKTIGITVPFGTNVTAMIATFSSTGVGVPTIAGTNQISTITPNNFTTPKTYRVIAADGSTADYVVTVIVAANSAKAIAPYSLAGQVGAINEAAKTIGVIVPFGTDVTTLVATFGSTGGGVPTIAGTSQLSGVTPNNFATAKTYRVTAVDGSTADYVVTVIVAANSAKAIAPYSLAGVQGIINEAAKTIGITVPFGTNVTALIATFSSTGNGVPTIAGINQISTITPNNFTTPKTYRVTAVDGSTADYVVTVVVAPNSAKAIAPYSLNGISGTINETLKTIDVTVPFGTDVTALIATFSSTGVGVPTIAGTNQISTITPNNFATQKTYRVTAIDGSTADYVVTVTIAANSAKAIAPYSLNGVQGIIDENAKTIGVTVPFGTDVTALIATFTSTGAGVPTIAGTNQISTITPNNFTLPKTYRVTAVNGTTADYVVTVTVAVNSAKAIAPYSLAGVSGTINEAAKTIGVTVPFGTNVTALVATFTSTGVGVPTIAGINQVSGTTPNSFAAPKTYRVTASDGSTADYVVTVTVAVLANGPAGAVDLKTAAPFGIIAFNAITNSAGLSHIYGDVALTQPGPGGTIASVTGPGTNDGGVAPFKTSTMVTNSTGVTPGMITAANNGTPVNIAALPQLLADLNAAYLELQGRAAPVTPLTTAASAAGVSGGTFTAPANDLSGFILSPGIYTATGTYGLSNTSGPLVLDAGGNPDAVFIIRSTTAGPSGFTSTTGSVVLQGGAKAKNVFWVVDNLTVGAGTFFQGTAVVGHAITLLSFANVEGRMLAGSLGLVSGAITLTNTNIITVPQ